MARPLANALACSLFVAAIIAASQTGKWRFIDRHDKLTNKTIRAMGLAAEEGPIALLGIACQGGKWEVWLESTAIVAVRYEPIYKTFFAEISMRYTDEKKIRTHTFTRLPNAQGFFFYNGSSIYDGPSKGIKKLLGHPGAVIRFATADGNWVTAEFDLTATKAAVGVLERGCKR